MKIIKHLSLIFVFCTIFSCVSQKQINYTIKKNEKISDVAKRYDLKTEELLRLNPRVGKSPKEGTVIVVPVKGSTNNAVEIKGTKISYQFHTVQSKETVYAITKKYEISKETLIKWNPKYPNIVNNLIDVGQVLKVKRIEQDSVNYVTKKEEKYLTHIIGSNDTLYSITRKYDVSKEDLIKLNPELTKLQNNIVNIGDVLKIKLLATINNENYRTHKVKKNETLFSLMQKYAISKEDLINFNPELINLKNNIINIGDVLKIPASEEVETVESIYQDKIISGSKIRLAMLYPFNSQKYAARKSKDIFKKNKLINIVTDYYLGAEIAINSLRKQGIDIELSVFDTGNKGTNVPGLIKNGKLENFDVLIGPFFANQAVKIAANVDYPVVFPHYSKRQGKFSSNKIIRSSPPTKQYVKKLSKYLKNKYTNEKIIIVGDGNSASNKNIESLILDLQKNNSILSSKISVLKPVKGYIKKIRFTRLMSNSINTWVILTSTKTSSISDALNSLLTLPEKMNIEVFTLKKGRAFKKVDNNKLARVNFSYVTDSYENLDDKATKDFKNTYKVKNNTTPTKYAFKGHDLTYDVLTRMASGKKLEYTLDKGSSTRLSNKFYYGVNNSNCYENKGLFILRYNEDLSLSRIDEAK